MQLQEGQRLAALEAEAAAAAAAATKPEQEAAPAGEQGAPSPGWPDQLLVNSEGMPSLPLDAIADQLPDLPSFELGSMDIDLKF